MTRIDKCRNCYLTLRCTFKKSSSFTQACARVHNIHILINDVRRACASVVLPLLLRLAVERESHLNENVISEAGNYSEQYSVVVF